jgi:hypothetical protein
MTDGTLKVTPITSAPSQQAHATFTITATIDGFPVQVEVEGKADALRGMIDRLKAIGATPPAPQNLQSPEPTKAAGAPLCPTHNTPMAPSTKRPGTYYCKSSVGQHPDDGRTLYCTKKG